MKSRIIVPRDIERIMREDEYIVSTTDPHGRITSVNDVFVEYSGYAREELLHAQHNILRHPDMPRAVFWLLWQALQAGEDFMGYVKNLSKDGTYYWVFAHILPERNADGEIAGYRSVRRAPRREAIARVAELYARMRAAEHAVAAKDAIPAGLRVLGEFLAAQDLSYEEMVARL